MLVVFVELVTAAEDLVVLGVRISVSAQSHLRSCARSPAGSVVELAEAVEVVTIADSGMDLCLVEGLQRMVVDVEAADTCRFCGWI